MFKIKQSRKELLKTIETLKNNNKVLTERNYYLNKKNIEYQKKIKEMEKNNG